MKKKLTSGIQPFQYSLFEMKQTSKPSHFVFKDYLDCIQYCHFKVTHATSRLPLKVGYFFDSTKVSKISLLNLPSQEFFVKRFMPVIGEAHCNWISSSFKKNKKIRLI